LRAVGSIPALNLKPLLKFRVPIPPLRTQDLISEALDKFEALIYDSTIGLPAEIELRRQQFDYFRENLFAFDAPDPR
jgi:type I restriction enzyme S subunit